MSDESRQFDPTALQLERAARRGQVAYSGELASAIVLAGGLTAVLVFGPAVLRAGVELVAAGMELQATSALATLLWSLLPLLASVLVLALLAGLVQLGWRVPAERPGWDWQRVSPSTNLRRLLSGRTGVRLVLQLVKIVAIGLIGYTTIAASWQAIVAAGVSDIAGMLSIGRDVAIQLAVRCCLALLAIGVIDYLYQRWQLRRDLRMTRQQVQDDLRQSERHKEHHRPTAAKELRNG